MKKNSHGSNSRTSLTQAKDPRSCERDLSLKLQVLAQARLPTESPAKLVNYRLGEPSSLERDHHSPKGEVPRLGYNFSDVPQVPTSSRLGESLSLEQDSTLLKTRALRLSESSSMNLGLFCQSRLGETDSLGRKHQISPLFSLHQPYIHTQTT